MSYRTSLMILALIACLGGCSAEVPPESAESDEDLTALVALPYLSWSSEDADPEQLGVTAWDQELAWEGVNFYTDDISRAFLMDMSGRRLHTWSAPEEYKRCEQFELLAGGEILMVCVGQALVKLNWRSEVVWVVEMPVHHDVAVRADGSLLAPRGGEMRDYQSRQVGFDRVVHLSPEGEQLSEWRSFDHLDELHEHHPPSHLDSPPEYRPKKGFDYYHLNSVEILPETPLGLEDARFRQGNILICLRNVHLIAVLDQETFSVTWSWGPGELSFPHMPTMLPSGNILIFDNGVSSKNSRVLELDPRSGEIVWLFEGDPPNSFFTKRRGSNQRLPNGNTLICESDKGHVIEVTPDGQTVWEFWNPDLKGKRRKRIYRFMRQSKDEVTQLIRGSSG